MSTQRPTTRFRHPTWSQDLIPRELVVADTGFDLLYGLRNVSEPSPNEFVDTFALSPAVAFSEAAL